MYPKLIFFLISWYLWSSTNLHAQYENFWAFGSNAGINFNSNPPQVVRTAIKTNEGSASICDDQGRLLFYTDGTDVWDRNNSVMPNGNDLPGIGVNVTGSTTQGALIIPRPGNSQQYYVFSLACIESGFFSGNLYYSVVDISLNNGLGAVIANRKGILLSKGLSEQMTAVSGGNCDIWLLVTPKLKFELKAYNVGFNGIDTVPVLSGLRVANGLGGSIDVAPDRSKLAIGGDNLTLYDFDRYAGRLTNPVLLDKVYSYYGVCFSPDNTKLYGSGKAEDDIESSLLQFDLNTADTHAMIASKKKIAAPPYFFAIKRGPDGKIYGAGFGEALNVIHQPNLVGAACQYVAHDLPLLPGTSCTFGLPNSATIVINRKVYSTTSDTAYCTDSFLLEAKIPSGINYVWEDSSTGPNRYVKHTGTYWVSYQLVGAECMEYADTFHPVVFPVNRTYATTRFEGMCAADTFLLAAAHANSKNYIWEDGSRERSRKMNRSGTFWVSYQHDTACAYFVDTFLLSYPQKEYPISFSVDTLICQQQLLSLRNTSDPHYQSFNWFFGEGKSSMLKNPDHVYPHSGTYEIMLTGSINENCQDTAVQLLLVDSIFPVSFTVDRDKLCVGELITVSHQMNINTIAHILWQWGDGHELEGLTDIRIPHAYDISGPMPVTMRVNFRSCPDDSFSLLVQVYALPEVHLYSEGGLCFQGAALTLKNLGQNATTGYHYLWSTGSVADSIRVTHHGPYSLTVSTEPLGCSTTENIEISKDCYINIPNAFTPNGDGVNDYFFPRQLLTKNVSSFHMEVFNRWGQAVFETKNGKGGGWDGQFNGTLQPTGVYVYKIVLRRDNDVEEIYQGNVTLIR